METNKSHYLLKIFIINFFNSVCLNSLSWFFFISIQPFIYFIQVSSSLLIVQPDLSSTFSCFLRCLFCFQSSYSTPHHSWKACSHSPLDDVATDNQRVKNHPYSICSPCYGMHIWCYDHEDSTIPSKREKDEKENKD